MSQAIAVEESGNHCKPAHSRPVSCADRTTRTDYGYGINGKTMEK